MFLFIADGLAALLRHDAREEHITPLKVCLRAPGISHLLFADDTLLFFRATEGEATRIRGLLDVFARATGQLINPQKCSILFGKHCRSGDKDDVVRVLGVQNASFEEKYLGLPTPNRRMSKGRFKNIQEKFTKRFVMWCDHMARSGRKVLIKSIAQALPTYLMSVFRLPASTCNDLTRMVRNYWWGGEKGRRETHWRAWEKLIQP